MLTGDEGMAEHEKSFISRNDYVRSRKRTVACLSVANSDTGRQKKAREVTEN